ncbi:MAG: tagaturonate reductase [Bacteroidota bacterium]|jgi:tagaturonate reductase
MTQLTRAVVHNKKENFPAVKIGSLAAMPEKVLQFGEGNFLRAFVDWQFNELINAGLFTGSIVVIQPLASGMVRQLNEQDGLYTVVQRGYREGKLIERMDVVTAISRGINPYEQYDEFLDCARNPDLRFIISNTTEAGIEYVRTERPSSCPHSYPAKVAVLLYERYKKFKGDPAKGLIIIPCELIEANGDHLKQYVLQHAADWHCEPEFTAWIEQSNYFYNTLVDRIVPGYPKDEADALNAAFGYVDKNIVACEVFHKWVIQGNEIAQKELPFTKIGLNVVWTDDITPHRTLKVRILNGAHTTFTIPSILSGNEFVKESMDDAVVGAFIQKAVFDEILPTLRFSETEKEKFARAVLERFKNPFIKHALLSITLNSVSKYKVRVLPSLLEYVTINASVPRHLAMGLAALIRFYKPESKNEKGYQGMYNGKSYPISDSADVVEMFDAAWKKAGTNHAVVAKEILSNIHFWETDLAAVAGLLDDVVRYLSSIEKIGMKETLRTL